VGDEKKITRRLSELKHNPENISVVHAPEFIGMDEKPKEAIENKRNASILVAARLVADGKADALVSAGNTGACILACSRTFKKIPGISKSAFAAVYPTEIRRGGKERPILPHP
jgi:glycerol-3-phosphate acyltransferase PlsX